MIFFSKQSFICRWCLVHLVLNIKFCILVSALIILGARAQSQTIIWQESFDPAPQPGWNLNVSNGTNGPNYGVWEVNGTENGSAVGACCWTGGTNKTLHVEVQNAGSGQGNGAGAYYVGGFSLNTARRCETPAISTLGYNNLSLEFKYLEGGNNVQDNFYLQYSVDGGVTWQFLANPATSDDANCFPAYEWGSFTVALPPACNNIANLKIGFCWQYQSGMIGTDLSCAVNDVEVKGSLNTTITDTCKTTQISLNTGVDENGNLLPIGAQDMNWEVTSVYNTLNQTGLSLPYNPYVISPHSTWYNSSTSRWINLNNTFNNYGGPITGQVQYTRHFTTLFNDTFKVKLLFSVDAAIDSFKIDGINYYSAFLNPSGPYYWTNQYTALNDSVIYLDAGCHDITLFVTDAWNGTSSYNPGGFKFEGYIQSLHNDSSILKQNCTTNTPPTLSANNTLNYCSSCQPLSPNLSITSGTSCGNLDSVKVYFTSGYNPSQDTLQFVPQLGINSYYNNATGVLTLYGNANYGVWETVLKTVCYKSKTANSVSSIKNVVISLGSALYNPSNGHYYKLVNNNVDWQTAKQQASQSNYYGKQGYLATITSAQEDNFLMSLINSEAWFGASDAAQEGVWRWVTGCEGLEDNGQGRHFLTNSNIGCSNTPNNIIIGGNYNNFIVGINPDNFACSQHFGRYWNPNNTGYTWDDFSNVPQPSYIIEYGCMPGDSTINIASNITINILPKKDTTINQTICQGQSFLGYNTTGVHKDTFASVSGCDSVRTLNLTVNPCTTCDTSKWIATYEILSGGYYPVNTSNFVDSVNGWTYLNPATAPNSYYWSTFKLKDTMCVSSDFAIEYRIKTGPPNGISAYDTYLAFLTPNGTCWATLMGDAWGQPWTSVGVNGTTIAANQPYLIFPNLYNWSTVKLEFVAGSLKFYMNGTLFTTIPYPGTICSITGLVYTFKGSGYCDWIKITNNQNDTLYFEDFNNCKTLASFNDYCTPPMFSVSKIMPTCSSDTLRLFATPTNNSGINYSYQWTGPNGFISNQQNPIIPNPTASANGTYSCKVIINSCISDSTKTINVSGINSGGSTGITINQSICQGQSYLGYTATGIYNDTFTAVNGCDSIRTINLTVHPIPTVIANANPGNIICAGTTLTLFGSGANTYTWTGGVTNNIGFIPTASGVYTITGTSSTGCSNTSVISVTINPLPNVSIASLPNPATICVGSPIQLTASGAATYSWSGGITNGTSFNPTATTTYTVTAADNNGCTTTATKLVTVNPLPNVNSTSSPVNGIVCSGNSITLTGTGASTYTWSGGITNGVAFTPTSSGVYTVTGTDANGCVKTNTKSITVNALPNVLANVTPNDTVCAGTTITLSGSGANTYTWNSGVSNNISFVPLASSIYTVTGTDLNSCSSTSTIYIQVNPKPSILITSIPSNGQICKGAPIVLTASGAPNLSWSHGGANGSSVSPSTTSTYTVTGTSAFGCTASTSITVTVNPVYNVQDTAYLCGGLSINYGGQTLQTQGVYTFNLGTSNGCDSIVTLHLFAIDQPIYKDMQPEHCCLNEPVTITYPQGSTFYSYEWSVTNGNIISQSSGSITSVFNRTGVQEITLRVVPPSPCNSILYKDYIYVHKPDAKIVSSKAGLPICVGDEVVLRSLYNNGYTYVWQPSDIFNSTTSQVIVQLNQNTVAQLTVTDSFNCSSSDTMALDVENCCTVFVPNAFSPNGDDINDRFTPKLETGVELKRLIIYNRWGEKVFETSDKSNTWDGYYKGIAADVDSYYYLLEYECKQERKVLKGDFLLLR